MVHIKKVTRHAGISLAASGLFLGSDALEFFGRPLTCGRLFHHHELARGTIFLRPSRRPASFSSANAPSPRPSAHCRQPVCSPPSCVSSHRAVSRPALFKNPEGWRKVPRGRNQIINSGLECAVAGVGWRTSALEPVVIDVKVASSTGPMRVREIG